jgi:putative hydrolase of the HAD superfamily
MPAEAPRKLVVFFDIGKVLLEYDPHDAARAIARLLRRRPMKVARDLWASNLVDRIERGAIKPRDIYRLFSEELGYSGSYAEFKRLWSGFFRLNKGTAALFERLRRRGHKLYLFSNTNLLHWEHIKSRYAFAKRVDGAVLSFRLGLRKPEPRLYRYALKLARTRADRAVFIDDRDENVETAVKLGMNGLLFKSASKLEAELKRLGAL